MDESRRITVLFENKRKANDLGVLFDKQTRGWYLPENVSEEIKEKMLLLALPEEKEVQPAKTLPQTEEPTDTPSVETIFHSPDINWDAIIEKNDSLYCAWSIHENGLPKEEATRTKLLEILGNRVPGQYPVTYDGMCFASKEFSEIYSNERVYKLVTGCITGARPYTEEIRESLLTEEEKALLYFVLPM